MYGDSRTKSTPETAVEGERSLAVPGHTKRQYLLVAQ